MPKAANLSTENINKMIFRVTRLLEKGEMEPKVANSILSGYRSIIYGNQTIASEKRVENDVELRKNMEKLNDYIEHGGQIPDLEEVGNNEFTELQSNEDLPGGDAESQGDKAEC